MVRAVILAAGEGRRVRPLTHQRAKVMLPVGNRPILEHVLRALHRADIHDVTIVVGYHAEKVQRHFQDGSGYGVRIDYVHQDEPLSSADAFHQAVRAHPKETEFLLVPGDNYVGEEVLSKFLQRAKGDALLYTRSDHPQHYGVLQLLDHKVARIEEAPRDPKSDLVSTGIARITGSRAAGVKKFAKDPAGLTQFLDHLSKSKPGLEAVELEGDWFDVDRPENLIAANALHLAHEEATVEGVVEPGASLVGAVTVGKGTRIRSGSYVVGPVSFGQGCEIGPHAVIYGPASIGDNVTIGPFTELMDSVVLADVRIASGCTLHHVVLDRGVVLAPRVSMDRAHVVEGPGFGAVVGDGAMFGNNVVVQPGSVVGNNARVAPHKTVGSLPDGARVV